MLNEEKNDRRNDNEKITKKGLIILICLIVLGGIFRVALCFTAYPYHIHPDEPTIVDSAINMISRHSWEANVYNRPDHFEIKCCAGIFQIFSYLRYGTSAYEAYSNHEIVFYLLARGFTVFFGLLMIPLAYILSEKIMKKSGLICAGLVAFFPLFVEHSAYATPDIVLTFFIMLIAYFSILYLKDPKKKTLAYICLFTGIGITIKYTCAIACIWIAMMVCIVNISQKNYLGIIKNGIFCLFLIILITFLIAPNLFTNISKTINTLKIEARSEHLGADGLGFGGNFIYYLKTFLEKMGIESIVFFCIGIFYCIKTRSITKLPLVLGFIFWICTSILALHWERWGMPIYIFFVIITSVGICYSIELIKGKYSSIFKIVFYIIASIIIINIIIYDLVLVQKSLLPIASIKGIDFCYEHGINKSNTLYEGYTPLNLRWGSAVNIKKDKDNHFIIPKKIEFIIISSGLYERYYNEPERYSKQIEIYDYIQNNFTLIYDEGKDNYENSSLGIINIFLGIKNLLKCNNGEYMTPNIKIYSL